MSGKKKEETVVESRSTTAEGEMPSVDSPDFEQWIAAPGNVEKLFS